jgi:hypothetical protein
MKNKLKRRLSFLRGEAWCTRSRSVWMCGKILIFSP